MILPFSSLEHVVEYFAFTGETMKLTNDEYIETAHGMLNRREQQINAKSTRDPLSKEKQKRHNRLIVTTNSMNKKFIMACDSLPPTSL